MTDVHDRLAVAEIVSDLILLERDATAAYVRILQRLGDAEARTKISAYVEARQRRLGDLTRASFSLRSRGPERLLRAISSPSAGLPSSG